MYQLVWVHIINQTLTNCGPLTARSVGRGQIGPRYSTDKFWHAS